METLKLEMEKQACRFFTVNYTCLIRLHYVPLFVTWTAQNRQQNTKYKKTTFFRVNRQETDENQRKIIVD